MHTSQERTCFQCLTRSEERSRGAHGAFFDFAQNEEEFDMPSTAYLILSEVEGRTTPMQCSKMCACPSAKAGTTKTKMRLQTIVLGSPDAGDPGAVRSCQRAGRGGASRPIGSARDSARHAARPRRARWRPAGG